MNFPACARNAVLVVEDDPLVRLGAVDLVEDAGYVVYEAADAKQALALLERHKNIFAIFTDVEMPGSIDGVKLAHMVNRRWPPLAILVASGFAKLSSDDLPYEALFFAKPYTTVAITKALSNAAPQG